MFISRLVSCSTFICLLSAQAFGQLEINIDTANKEFFFTGSDTGNFFRDSDSDDIVDWELQGVFVFEGFVSQDIIFSPADAFSFTYGNGAAIPDGAYIEVSSSTNPADSYFALGIAVMTPSGVAIDTLVTDQTSTVSGTGFRVSYAGFSGHQQNAFESLIGSQTTDLMDGEGWSPISVVPESSSFTLITGILGLFFLLLRRR
jgi:hypothetical protein